MKKYLKMKRDKKKEKKIDDKKGKTEKEKQEKWGEMYRQEERKVKRIQDKIHKDHRYR